MRLRARSTTFLLGSVVIIFIIHIAGAYALTPELRADFGDTSESWLVETTAEPPTLTPTATATLFVCNPNAPIQRVNVSSSGVQAANNYDSLAQTFSISADGRFIVFDSEADNLTPNINNGIVKDVFLHDRVNCQTTRISRPSNGVDDLEDSRGGQISGNGRYIVFSSGARNLVPGDNDFTDLSDIFLYDVQTSQMTQITETQNISSSGSFAPFISESGRYIGFTASGANFDSNYTNGIGTFLYDRVTNTFRLMSNDINGIHTTGFGNARFLDDELRIAFSSRMPNFVANDMNYDLDIFLHNIATGQNTRINLKHDGSAIEDADPYLYTFDISGDGRRLVFPVGNVADIMPQFAVPYMIYLRDLQTGNITPVSMDEFGEPLGDRVALHPNISNDGRYVAFIARTLLCSYCTADLFVKDMGTGTLTHSLTLWWFDVLDSFLSFSHDGRSIAVTSSLNNLVPNDTNNADDVFVLNWQGVVFATATHTPTSTPTLTVTNIAAVLPSVLVSRTSMTLTEGGVSVLYNARLSQAPAPGETITILPTGYDTAQISLSPASRLLDASNWNTGRNFTVIAVNDAIAEANAFTTISHTTSSNQPGSPFNGVTSGAISVTVLDNDATTATPTSQITVVPPTLFTPSATNYPPGYYPTQTANAIRTQFAMTETAAMSTATFTPTATATATITLTPTATATFTPVPSATATATFTPSPTLTPTRTATPSAAPQIIVTRASFAVTEGGAGVTYNVRLSQSPAPGETVTITASFDGAQISASPVSRQLNNTNWNTGRSITVTAVNDTVDEGEVLTVITHNATSSQSGSPFSGISGANISVSVMDND